MYTHHSASRYFILSKFQKTKQLNIQSKDYKLDFIENDLKARTPQKSKTKREIHKSWLPSSAKSYKIILKFVNKKRRMTTCWVVRAFRIHRTTMRSGSRWFPVDLAVWNVPTRPPTSVLQDSCTCVYMYINYNYCYTILLIFNWACTLGSVSEAARASEREANA